MAYEAYHVDHQKACFLGAFLLRDEELWAYHYSWDQTACLEEMEILHSSFLETCGSRRTASDLGAFPVGFGGYEYYVRGQTSSVCVSDGKRQRLKTMKEKPVPTTAFC